MKHRTDNSKVRRIGVLVPNKRFLGAQVVTIPFFYNLKKIFPKAAITAFSPVEKINILNNLGIIDNIIPNELAGFNSFKKTLKLIKEQKFDILFTLRRKSERDWLINMLSGIKLRTGFRRKWSPLVYHYSFVYDKNTYRAANFLKLLKPFNGNIPEYFPIYPEYLCKTSPAVWLIPCGSKKEKLWPVNSYIKLAEKIILELKMKVLFILGGKEKKYKDYILDKLRVLRKSIEFLIEEPVNVLLGESNNCISAVSNDCGPGHITQINGCKSLILFPENANVYEWVNREGNGFEVVSDDGSIKNISVDYVFSRLSKKLEQ